jgi:hypothetical protein
MDDDSQPDQITVAEREEAVRALIAEPGLILPLFDRSVREHDPHARRIVRDYLRVVSSTIANWHRTPGHP